MYIYFSFKRINFYQKYYIFYDFVYGCIFGNLRFRSGRPKMTDPDPQTKAYAISPKHKHQQQ